MEYCATKRSESPCFPNGSAWGSRRGQCQNPTASQRSPETTGGSSVGCSGVLSLKLLVNDADKKFKMSSTMPNAQFLVNKRKKYFMDMPAPPGYVAGIGRGATGFTTRSDIGPARDSTDVTDDRHAHPLKRSKLPDEPDEVDLNESNYDEFAGYGGSLFKNDPYDEDDREADVIYNAVDDRMDEKRKDYRERKLAETLEEYRVERPKIQHYFSDVKRDLANMSDADWNAIPEVGDARNKKQRNPRQEKFTPLPDSVLAQAAGLANPEMLTSIRARSGGDTPLGMSTPVADLDLRKVGEAKSTLMGLRLNQASDSVSGQTVVDPKGYLTDLQSMVPSFGASIQDIKKARLLLKSVCETNPKHAPAWIASANLEEVTNKMQTARNIILRGCEACPQSEDIWIEAARLHQKTSLEHAKSIMAQAIKHLPQSVRVWVKAANLEETPKGKRRVYRKALESVPNSVRLWKEAVELEGPEDARILLSRAVECCPTSVDLWLALARLESYENAKKVLNKARENIPTDRQVWITAAKLEEANGNSKMVEKIIKRALMSLRGNHVEIKRGQWFDDAVDAELSSAPETCQTIVLSVIGVDVEDEDRFDTWMADAESFAARKAYECARTAYKHLIQTFPYKAEVWLAAAKHEKEHGTRESFEALLEQAITYCPNVEALWLMLAKSRWVMGNDVPGARATLARAFEANPNSEDIWLAAVKLESENRENHRAQALLRNARQRSATARIYLKSARLEWGALNDLPRALELIQEGVEKFPDFAKFYMMRGQIYEQQRRLDDALRAYEEGCKRCQASAPLWVLRARLLDKQATMNNDVPIKARATLEQARQTIRNNAWLWLESVQLEIRHGRVDVAKQTLARALQNCTEQTGMLWAESIFLEPRATRRGKSHDALKKCEKDPYVVLAVAKLMWSLRLIARARHWFETASQINPDIGITWAYWYKFETLHGNETTQQQVLDACGKADPHHSVEWCRFLKDVRNWGLPVGEVLKRCAEQLPVPD